MDPPKTISDNKKIEVPVFEDVQMGMSMGMALEGSGDRGFPPGPRLRAI